MHLHGIFVPITTPFYPDGRVYYKKLEHNVDRYSRAPIAGIVPLGSTGEAVMLSDEERRQVLREAAAAASPEKVLIAGTGAESVFETLALTEYAATLGYDAALVRTPHYYKPQMQPENILTFYRTVADRSPLPILLYSVPVFTGYDLPLDFIAALAEHPNIIGIKESSGNVEKIRQIAAATQNIHREVTVTEIFTAVTGRMMRASEKSAEGLVSLQGDGGAEKISATAVAAAPKNKIKTRSKDAGFQILCGAAHFLLDSLDAGAVGAVLGFAAPAPTACFEIYTAWKDRDAKLAREKQERLSAPAKRIVSHYGVPAIKHAEDLNGYYGGPPRLPLLPLTAAQKLEVETLMKPLPN